MDDAGTYMVKAINIEGEAKCESQLNILPAMSHISMTTEQMIIQPNGFPPEFLQLFTDRQGSLNSTIKFEARLIGTQPLNVKHIYKKKFSFCYLLMVFFPYYFRSIGYLMDHQYRLWKTINVINNKILVILIH